MLRHIVLLTLSVDADDGVLSEISDALYALLPVIPEIESYSVERDLGLAEGNSTLAIVGEFADEAAYRVYAEHPVHLDVIASKIKPFVVARSAVQVNLD